MNGFLPALWVEALKARRSKVPWLSALGFSLAAFAGGLFMIILKDPEAARSMGLISTKAQLVGGTADWPAFFNMLAQAVAIGGYFVFAIVTAWVFGREFSDHTVKELLAVPVSRAAIVGAKFAVVAGWTLGMSVFVFGIGLVIGYLVNIPGWSMELLQRSAGSILGAAMLTIALQPFVALIASMTRGYLPAFGWATLTVVLAQIAAALGWGDWFPWSVPALFSGAAGSMADQLGVHSYLGLIVACVTGIAATLVWWQRADQAR